MSKIPKLGVALAGIGFAGCASNPDAIADLDRDVAEARAAARLIDGEPDDTLDIRLLDRGWEAIDGSLAPVMAEFDRSGSAVSVWWDDALGSAKVVARLRLGDVGGPVDVRIDGGDPVLVDASEGALDYWVETPPVAAPPLRLAWRVWSDGETSAAVSAVAVVRDEEASTLVALGRAQ